MKKVAREVSIDIVAPNHNIVSLDNGNLQVLFSYDSKVVVKDNNKVTLGRNWDYSRTTMKYVSQFLDSSAKETRDKIAKKIYKIDDSL